MEADMYVTQDIYMNHNQSCKKQHSPSPQTIITGETLAKILSTYDNTLGHNPTATCQTGKPLTSLKAGSLMYTTIRASLMALMTMCTIMMLNEGWRKKRITYRTPRNRQQKIKLGNGLFGTTTLHKYITRHTHYRVSGRRPRSKILSLKQKESLLPTLEEMLGNQKSQQEGKKGKHLNNTEIKQLLQGDEQPENLTARLKATCKHWHKQMDKAAMNELKQEIAREEDNKRRERREQKKAMKKEAEAKATTETVTTQKLGGKGVEVARTKQVQRKPHPNTTYPV